MKSWKIVPLFRKMWSTFLYDLLKNSAKKTLKMVEAKTLEDLKTFSLFDGAEPKEGKYKNAKTKAEFPYIKKADMKQAFPAGGYIVVGQIGKGDEQIGTLFVNGCEEPVYRTSKKAMTKIAGFAKVGENEFLAVVKSTWLLLLLILLLVALLCGLLGFLLHKFLPTKPEESPTLPPIIIDAGAEEGEGKLEIPDKIETTNRGIKVNGVPVIHMKANQLEQNFPFANPKENPCFFVIDLMLKDSFVCTSCKEKCDSFSEKCPHCGKKGTVSYEVIYTSDMIPPGYAVSNFKLNRPLPKGAYNVIIHYNTYSFDQERRPLNDMNMHSTIVAE